MGGSGLKGNVVLITRFTKLAAALRYKIAVIMTIITMIVAASRLLRNYIISFGGIFSQELQFLSGFRMLVLPVRHVATSPFTLFLLKLAR